MANARVDQVVREVITFSESTARVDQVAREIVALTNPNVRVTQVVREMIVAPPGAIGITCDSPPDGNIAVEYTHAILASGGNPPYTFSIVAGALPAGLSISPTTGVISGIPSNTGTSNFTVQVTDTLGYFISTPCSIEILDLHFCLTCANPVNGTVGTPYSETVAISGGTAPYTFTYITGLPPELTINSSGVISGTPASAGLYRFTVQVHDSGNSVSVVTCGFAVVCSPPC